MGFRPAISSLAVAALGLGAAGMTANAAPMGETATPATWAAAAPMAGPMEAENHYRSSAGVDVNALIGASRFYDAGYAGAGAVMANVEAGHVWNGHESLGHVTTFVHETTAPGAQTGEVDRHATWVGHAMGGRAPAGAADPARPQGVAPNAELWSGAIATAWGGNRGNPDYSLSFGFSTDTYSEPYQQIMVTGVPGAGGRTADVVNSSWGNGTQKDGFNYISVSMDAMINQSGVVFTASAGNTGPAPNTIGAPASGFNALTVGALQPTAENDYDAVANFSSRGPQEVFNPQTGQTIQGARARVDIAAPGQNLSLAFYEGASGGNKDDPTPVAGDPTAYSGSVSGTSFAAPTVAGGAALVIDAGRGELAGEAETRVEDGRVVKAVLLNSADKIPGWNNGQAQVGAVVTTTQSLDYASGAGAMNLDTAYDQLLAGTTDVAGLGGGDVEEIGWDFGQVAQNAPTDYFIDRRLAGGSLFTSTLAWFVDATFAAPFNGAFADSFDDLDLEIWAATEAGVFTSKIAESISQYNTVEHLHFMLPTDGFYGIRVRWFGENWDFNGDANQEFFGLAWNGAAVPAPGMLVLFALAAMIGLRRRTVRG